MLTYSVVVLTDSKFDNEELVLQTYSNEKAAKDHEKFVRNTGLYINYEQWDYVTIRTTRVANVFEDGTVDIDQSEPARISLEECLNDLEHDRDE